MTEREQARAVRVRIEAARRVAQRQILEGVADPDDAPGLLRFRYFIRELLRTEQILKKTAEHGGWTPELTSWLGATEAIRRRMFVSFVTQIAVLYDLRTDPNLSDGQRELAYSDFLLSVVLELNPLSESFQNAARAAHSIMVERGAEQAFMDPSGRHLDRLLSNLRLSGTPENRAAFWAFIKSGSAQWHSRSGDDLERYVSGSVSNGASSLDGPRRAVDRRPGAWEELLSDPARKKLSRARERVAMEAAGRAAAELSPGDEIEHRENLEHLMNAAGLTRRERELALTLSLVGAPSIAEAAREMGLAESTGRVHAMAIRDKLRAIGIGD